MISISNAFEIIFNIHKLFSNKIISCTSVQEKPGNYHLVLTNEGTKSVEINNILSNELPIGELDNWSQINFPLHLNPKCTIRIKYYLTKDHHYEVPRMIAIEYKNIFRVVRKKYSIN